MNKNTPLIVGGVIAVAIIAGLVFFGSKSTTPPVADTSSTTTTTDTSSTPTPPATPVAGAPFVTTNSSVAATDTTVLMSGTVTPNGAFTNYWYEYGTTANLGNMTVSQSVGSGYVAISAPIYITGLVKDTTYYIHLVASNQYGRTAGVVRTFQTTHGNPPPVGSAPATKTLSASGVTRTTANLNGEVTSNQATTQYWFEYGTTAELGNTSAFTNAGSGSMKVPVSISLSDLKPLTTYYFRLNAQNQFGTVNGAILNFKTSGPANMSIPAVTTKNATNVATKSATLHGMVDPNGSETKYWFEYSTDSILGSILLHSTGQKSAGAGMSADSVSTDISGLASNTAYYFRIVAQNSEGIVRGDIMTFKTK